MIDKEFTIPKYVTFDEGSSERYARIAVEPFERGYGTTVGNSLRRVLLSSLHGSAVTAMRIEGVTHEFAAIPGVREDVTDLVLNLKKCEVSLRSTEPLIFTFAHKGQKDITVADLFDGQEVDVFNPDFQLFSTTSKTVEIQIEMKVDCGRGYVTAEHFELEHAPLGTIYLDANFSPVSKVNFQVEDARVGQMTDYDRLLLDIWTDGSITPEKALEEAAGLVIDHLRIFVKQEQESDGEIGEAGGEDPELMRTMARSVDELELSVRAANCLKAANIATLGELVVRSEAEMLQFHNFGKKSLDEIKAILESMGMSLGMNMGDSVSLDAPAGVKDSEPGAMNEEE
jgi:DNA-directed RNA polymerase subunit alpha